MAGTKLFQQFCLIQHIIRTLYERIIEDAANVTVQEVMEELCKNLEEFQKITHLKDVLMSENGSMFGGD